VISNPGQQEMPGSATSPFHKFQPLVTGTVFRTFFRFAMVESMSLVGHLSFGVVGFSWGLAWISFRAFNQ
jgi:hypothetical protein